jgi:hypothetical protein
MQGVEFSPTPTAGRRLEKRFGVPDRRTRLHVMESMSRVATTGGFRSAGTATRPSTGRHRYCRGPSCVRASRRRAAAPELVVVIVLAAPPPILPMVGDVCWVSRTIRNTHDKRAFRPCVVVKVPLTIHGLIVVVTRTRDPRITKGLPSPPMPAFRLDDPGNWSHRETVEASLWRPPEAKPPVGRLDAIEISDILSALRISWEDL